MVYSRLEKVLTSCLTTVETEADGSFESRNSQSQSWQYRPCLQEQQQQIPHYIVLFSRTTEVRIYWSNI